jgi:fumarate reductase flavoprotein subunit
VALLEKTSAPGGSTLTSGGSFAFAGTERQKALGIDDSPERLAEDLMKVSGGRADRALVRLYVESQLDAFEWLKDLGVDFHKVSLSSNTSVPRTHPTLPAQVIDALHARVRATPGLEYFAQSAADSLVVGKDGRVEGVRVATRTGKRTLRGRSVVLASGGFARNPALLARFAPIFANAHAWGGEGNTGDGLVMAIEYGATLVDMDHVTGTFGIAINRYPELEPRAGDEVLLRMAMYRGAIAVNLNAERFADESLSYKTLGARCLEQPQGIAFQVFDQPVMDQSAPAPNLNNFRDALEKGAIKTAPTLEALAKTVGLDAAKLASTVARYNAAIAKGHDADFGRSTLGGGYGLPVPIQTAPFYILPCCTALLSTYCGLRVDTGMRVLQDNGRPIPGLYAAGEVVGGFHGAGYMSGSALGKAAIFGRVAGRSAVAYEH